jgi:hypothetical protein
MHKASKQTDPNLSGLTLRSMPSLFMLATIKVLKGYDTMPEDLTLSLAAIDEALVKRWENIVDTVRYFHKNNNCGCLHDVYTQLKQTTPTSRCHYCNTEKDLKDIKSCSCCNLINYCSRVSVGRRVSMFSYTC